MEQDELTTKRRERVKDLTEVASLIRPLPEHVTPSDEFMRRTRIRILKLEADPQTTHQQAA